MCKYNLQYTALIYNVHHHNSTISQYVFVVIAPLASWTARRFVRRRSRAASIGGRVITGGRLRASAATRIGRAISILDIYICIVMPFYFYFIFLFFDLRLFYL